MEARPGDLQVGSGRGDGTVVDLGHALEEAGPCLERLVTEPRAQLAGFDQVELRRPRSEQHHGQQAGRDLQHHPIPVPRLAQLEHRPGQPEAVGRPRRDEQVLGAGQQLHPRVGIRGQRPLRRHADIGVVILEVGHQLLGVERRPASGVVAPRGVVVQVAGRGGGRLARVDQQPPRVLAHRLRQPVPRPARVLGTTVTSDVSTSRPSASRVNPGATAWAAAASNPPTNTASRRNACCSVGSRSCWLHSTDGPHRCATPAPGGLAQARLDARQDLGHRHRGHPRRGQLDPQRQTVETGAELGHERLVVLVHDEVRPPRPGPLDEQAGRVLRRQRVDRPHRLATDVEGLTAGRHDPEVGAPAEQARRQLGARVDDVLTVVEDEEDVAGVEAAGEGVDRGRPARAADAQRRGPSRRPRPPSAATPPDRPARRHRPAAGPAAPPTPGPTGSCPRRRARSGSTTGSGATPRPRRPISRSRPISGVDGHREPRPVTHPRPPMASRYVVAGRSGAGAAGAAGTERAGAFRHRL